MKKFRNYKNKKKSTKKKNRKTVCKYIKGGVNSPKHSQILDYLYGEYLTNPKFQDDPEIHKYISKNYSSPDEGFNKKKHLELLRLIAFQIEKKSNSPEYIDFLKTLLFTLLEEPGLSHQHTIFSKQNPALYSKLNELESYSSFLNDDKGFIFKDPDRDLSISNTQLHRLAEIFENNPHASDSVIAARNSSYKRKRSSPSHSYNKTKKK